MTAPPRPDDYYKLHFDDPDKWTIWVEDAGRYIEHLEAENREQKKDLAWAEFQEGKERARRMKAEARIAELEARL